MLAKLDFKRLWHKVLKISTLPTFLPYEYIHGHVSPATLSCTNSILLITSAITKKLSKLTLYFYRPALMMRTTSLVSWWYLYLLKTRPPTGNVILEFWWLGIYRIRAAIPCSSNMVIVHVSFFVCFFCFVLFYFFFNKIKKGRFIYNLWAFLKKQLFHSYLLDMRWL